VKILIPIIAFGRSGGYRVLSQLANHWIQMGHEVDFLVDERSPSPYFPTSAGIVRFGSLGRASMRANAESEAFNTSGNALSIYVRMWLALVRKARRYDVLLANHSLTAFPVAFCFATNVSKHYYVQAYEPEYFEALPGWKNRILRFLSTMSYRLPLHQVANSPLYIGYQGIKARSWVAPGVDRTVFVRRAAPPCLSEGSEVVLGTIGRSEPGKGTRYVLDAFERLARNDARFKLKVAYGNLPADWSRLRTEVCVPTDDEELSQFYRSVDILLAAGTVQLGAFHYPVLESMSSGTPLVTTEYLPADASNAWIVPSRDSEAIANAVLEILQTPIDELTSKLDRAEAAVEEYSWPSVAQKFMTLIEEARESCVPAIR